MSKDFFLKVKTKGNTNPKNKPRVYFTCHPQDFDRAFEMISTDIFVSHDCAIYYTMDMEAEIPEENREIDLSRMNLFMIPVTFRLLKEPNRAKDLDFQFAKNHHIPVLPIMLEPGIDEIYSKEENFGELQYLTPYEQDITAIAYKDKLKKYLESVLISDETANRIRNVFDAYVFLSYRKIDRGYANKLMQFIHSDPTCQSIAVWYDEFLTPGESFKSNIRKLLADSKLFALLVTPNLPKRLPNGNKNFVIEHEYPDAKASGVKIIPIEMRTTSREELNNEFPEFPGCYHFEDKKDKERFIEVISNLAHTQGENNPEHDYLLGLAYLDGIDVEVNKNRAVSLFESSHQAGFIGATKQLAIMYETGNGVSYNIFKAAEYQLIVLNEARTDYSETHDTRKLIKELVDTAEICLSGKSEKMEPSPGKLFSIKEAIDLYREVVNLQEDLAKDPKAEETEVYSMRKFLSILCNLMHGYRETSEYGDDEVECFRKWAYYASLLGKESKSAEDVFHWRESNRTLLEVLGYNSEDYEKTLIASVNSARSAIDNECGTLDLFREKERVTWIKKKLNELSSDKKDWETIHKQASLMADLAHLNENFGVWIDYEILMDILYYKGVKYYSFLKQYDNVNTWLHACYCSLDEIKTLTQKDYEKCIIPKINHIYSFWLRLTCSGSINSICELLDHLEIDNTKMLVDEILQDLEKHYDRDDQLMRDVLIPGIKKLMNNKLKK